jgi:hypothetical protein
MGDDRFLDRIAVHQPPHDLLPFVRIAGTPAAVIDFWIKRFGLDRQRGHHLGSRAGQCVHVWIEAAPVKASVLGVNGEKLLDKDANPAWFEAAHPFDDALRQRQRVDSAVSHRMPPGVHCPDSGSCINGNSGHECPSFYGNTA